MFKDTIAAISTPFAQGGIGIVRISGPDAKNIASKVFKSVTNKSIYNLSGYQALFGNVFDVDGDFDEAVLLNFNQPHSYTGEDVIEISVHSGLYILKRLLRATIDAGARLADSGEFTKRAFLNKKISLTQAEAVMDLISAQNSQSANAAYMIKKGAIYNYILKIIKSLVKLDAHISAWIDYPEEDVVDVSLSEITKIILKAKSDLEFLRSTFDIGKIIKEGVNTVIIGKPNVGKSTLMNLLSGVNKSIVTDIPGTTRDIIEENVLLDDIMLNLYDTAGLRETTDIVEQQGVLLAKDKIKEADVVLAVFDNSRKFDKEDELILDQIKDKNCIAIINKSDLIAKLDQDKIKNKITDIVMVNSKNIKTKKIISDKIKECFKIKNIDPSAVIISNERQLYCIKNAIKSLENALKTLNNGFTYDVISLDIEETISHLMELTGEKVSDKVIDEIFNNFCVGK